MDVGALGRGRGLSCLFCFFLSLFWRRRLVACSSLGLNRSPIMCVFLFLLSLLLLFLLFLKIFLTTLRRSSVRAGVLNALCTGGVFSGQGRQLLVTVLSFFVDIPLSIGGVAVVVLYFRADLLDVYLYGVAAALLELAIAYGFIFASDWTRYAREARERQNAR